MACCTGESHTVCLSDEGILHSFGYNNNGQLGLEGDATHVSLPSRIEIFFINNQFFPLPIIKQVSCGAYFTICVDYEGSIYSFGQNHKGQLGTGNTNQYHFPQKVQDIPPVASISCGVYHTLAITNDDDLWSFGHNSQGQLCLGHTDNQSKPQKTPFSNIIKISAGYHSLFQNNKQEIFGCGSATYGQLGTDTLISKIEVGMIKNQPPNIIQFCSGYYHSLFLDTEGNVFSIGFNSKGNLGLGHNKDQNIFNQIPNIPPIQTISCVGHSSYLIDLDGNLWCFGLNDKKQLLFTNSRNINIPKKNEIEGITQIASGCCGIHFLAQNFENKIYIGGNNTTGQLGNGYTGTNIDQEMNSNYSSIWGNTQSVRNRVKSARK